MRQALLFLAHCMLFGLLVTCTIVSAVITDASKPRGSEAHLPLVKGHISPIVAETHSTSAQSRRRMSFVWYANIYLIFDSIASFVHFLWVEVGTKISTQMKFSPIVLYSSTYREVEELVSVERWSYTL